jgi:hypothetical protein
MGPTVRISFPPAASQRRTRSSGFRLDSCVATASTRPLSGRRFTIRWRSTDPLPIAHYDAGRPIGCLLRQDNDGALKELLATYEDGNASWLYTRALVAFRESGDSDEEAAALVRDAWSANEHVPAILAGAKPPVTSDDGYVTMGGPDEASYYVTECGAAWHRTPGAVAWLTKLVASLGRNGGHVRRCTDHLKRELDHLAPPLEGRMADIDWKPLPTEL